MFIFLKNCLRVAGILQSGAPYVNIRHGPRTEYNRQKSAHSERQQSWGVWGCSETPAADLGLDLVLKLRVKQVIYESKYNDNIKRQKPQNISSAS